MRLPDQIHINEIRRRLWSGGEYGRAAVMVGAGFSRNSEAVSDNIPAFPLWDDLARIMYRDLHPEQFQAISDRSAKENGYTGISPLRLASEYELTFGRNGLDDFLLRSIQDDNYRPGKLHEMLLSLPWSDVFTTNYDTLLERARPLIYDRRYDCIATASDIPTSVKPRIIKLHGSFSSHRPFIFTEEDYRTYPKKFAPFVNTVQQSLMENILCLIGFSASDPNFLAWTGWVRDNLGESTPYLYFCGLLDLSQSERRLFESKKIIPVDLSPLFPQDSYPDKSVRHRSAMEWFLLNLMQGAGPNVLSWPSLPTKNQWLQGKSQNLPDIPAWPITPVGPGRLNRTSSKASSEDLQGILQQWRECRIQYPGWVTCPRSGRQTLKLYTDEWLDDILTSCQMLDAPDDLHLLYELNWRLERTLTPLWTECANTISDVIERYNPFPRMIELDNAQIQPDGPSHSAIDWEAVGEQWVELAFALVRLAREDQDESSFQKWVNRLNNVSANKLEWQVRIAYEECMYHFFRFDERTVRTLLLQKWPDDSGMPFWEVKRAVLLAELGDVKEAKRIAEAALHGIRSRLSSNQNDCTLLSQEGWVMFALRPIIGSVVRINHDKWLREVKQFADRWDKLQSFRCNPINEVEMLCYDFARSVRVADFERKVGFDPGVETVTRRFGVIDKKPSLALNLMRMLEDGAFPLTLGLTSDIRDVLVDSVKAVAEYAPHWSLNVLLRIGKRDDIRGWFDRAKIASMAQVDTDRLFNLLSVPLSQAVADHGKGQHMRRGQQGVAAMLLEHGPELLSRLCLRSNSEQLDLLWDLACKVYSSPVYRDQINLYESVNVLFKRLSEVTPQPQLLLKLPDLLSLPIPGETGFNAAHVEHLVEPFHHIEWDNGFVLDTNSGKSEWQCSIDRLLWLVRHGTDQTRQRASLRLGSLYWIEGLTSGQANDYGEALWSRTDPSTHLPIATGFLDHAVLRLPEPEPGKAKTALRRHLLEAEFVQSVHQVTDDDGRQRISITDSCDFEGQIRTLIGATRSILREGRDISAYIDWTPAQALVLLRKAITWWSNEKLGLAKPFPFLHSSPRENALEMLRLLYSVILPRLSKMDDDTKKSAMDLISDTAQAGLDTSPVLPATLLLGCKQASQVTNELYEGLLSTNSERVRGAIIGIFEWCYLQIHKKLEPVPTTLLDALMGAIMTRRQTALRPALCHVTRLVHHMPRLLNNKHLDFLITGLQFLEEETRLMRTANTATSDDCPETIPLDLRPNIRSLSTELARVLYAEYHRRGEEPPVVINRWKTIAQNDPLPEVRKAWPNADRE